MNQLPCPYLKSGVEFNEDRERHIAGQHPDLLPDHRDKVARTLADPDQVRRSRRFGTARLFSRWFDDLRGGKHVVVVVVSESEPAGRHWVITAYLTRKLVEGEIEWARN